MTILLHIFIVVTTLEQTLGYGFVYIRIQG